MGSNTHEELALALADVQAALAAEREGSGASEAIIQLIASAEGRLRHAKEAQRAILGHREARPVLRVDGD